MDKYEVTFKIYEMVHAESEEDALKLVDIRGAKEHLLEWYDEEEIFVKVRKID